MVWPESSGEANQLRDNAKHRRSSILFYIKKACAFGQAFNIWRIAESNCGHKDFQSALVPCV
jgi:hypothetical protein